MTLLGIDIGGTSVKAAAIGPDGERRIAISDSYVRPDRSTLRAAIAQAVGGLGAGPYRAVGLCAPGRRNADRTAVELAVNVPGLAGYRFDAIVRDAVAAEVPFRVMSDAEAGTLDAARAHPGARRVLGVAIGTGVGCCLLEGGVAQRLGSGTIGHLGQVDIGPVELFDASGATAGFWSPLGPDGGRCSAEAYLGGAALRERLGEGFADRVAGLPQTDPAMVALARVIRIGLAVYTPDLVLLLGGVALALRERAGAIDDAVRRDLTSIAPAGWRLAFGESRHHAAFGAALAAGEAV